MFSIPQPQAKTDSGTTWGVPAEPLGPTLLFADNPESQEFVTTESRGH